MIKKIIYLAILVVAVSSCSTNKEFGKRKYYDFSNKSALSVSKTESFAIDNIISDLKVDGEVVNFTNNTLTTIPSADLHNSIESTSGFNEAANIKTQSSKKAIEHSVAGSNTKHRALKVGKKSIEHKASSDNKPGRLWWIWAIAAFVGLMIALFLSALFGFLIMSAALVLMVVCLIILFKSK